MVTEYFCTRAGCTPLTAFSKSSRVSSNRLARCTNCSFFAIRPSCETLQDHHNHLSSISQQQNYAEIFRAPGAMPRLCAAATEKQPRIPRFFAMLVPRDDEAEVVGIPAVNLKDKALDQLGADHAQFLHDLAYVLGVVAMREI